MSFKQDRVGLEVKWLNSIRIQPRIMFNLGCLGILFISWIKFNMGCLDVLFIS